MTDREYIHKCTMFIASFVLLIHFVERGPNDFRYFDVFIMVLNFIVCSYYFGCVLRIREKQKPRQQ